MLLPFAYLRCKVCLRRHLCVFVPLLSPYRFVSPVIDILLNLFTETKTARHFLSPRFPFAKRNNEHISPCSSRQLLGTNPACVSKLENHPEVNFLIVYLTEPSSNEACHFECTCAFQHILYRYKCPLFQRLSNI